MMYVKMAVEMVGFNPLLMNRCELESAICDAIEKAIENGAERSFSNISFHLRIEEQKEVVV